MSRHRFKTTHQGHPISVDMGWDRPLKGFFMVVQRDDAKVDEDTFLFDNLTQEVSHPCTLDPFLEELDRLNVAIPNEMLDEIRRDSEENVGNKYVEHRKDTSTGAYPSFSS